MIEMGGGTIAAVIAAVLGSLSTFFFGYKAFVDARVKENEDRRKAADEARAEEEKRKEAASLLGVREAATVNDMILSHLKRNQEEMAENRKEIRELHKDNIGKQVEIGVMRKEQEKHTREIALMADEMTVLKQANATLVADNAKKQQRIIELERGIAALTAQVEELKAEPRYRLKDGK